MSQELIYTSAPRGLKPGSYGFSTVACTQGMSAQLTARLEALSGYRQVFAPQDPQAPLNPVAWSHLRFTVAGRAYHVLSRVGAAGLDYSQRSNKFAHHVALEPAELSPAGPAWLLAAPGFMQTVWEGEPRTLATGPVVPAAQVRPAVCHAWQELTGDAGWGGVLAETAANNSKGLVTIVFPLGVDLLPLVAESLALLPPKLRWETTFSTYFTKLPPGVECNWRFVSQGSPEAAAAAGRIIDLCRPLGRAVGGPYVEAARTGIIAAPRPPSGVKTAELAQLLAGANGPPALDAAAAAPPLPDSAEIGLVPLLPASDDGDFDTESALMVRQRRRPPTRSTWPIALGIAAALLVVVGGGFATWFAMQGGLPIVENGKARAQPDTIPEPPRPAPPKHDQTPPDSPRAKPPKPDAPKAELPQGKPKTESPKSEPPKNNPPKATSPKPEPPNPEDAKLRARREAAAAIDGAFQPFSAGLSLPPPDDTTPHEWDLKLLAGINCKLSLLDANTLSSGLHLTWHGASPIDPPGGNVVLQNGAARIPPPTRVAEFSLAAGKLKFFWTSDAAKSRDNAAQLVNCVLQADLAGQIAGADVKVTRYIKLRAAASAPPISLFKALQSERNQVEFTASSYPISGQAKRLQVEFLGPPEVTPRPFHLESEPETLRIVAIAAGNDIPVIFKVILTDTGKLVVKYEGAKLDWQLPPSDPLASVIKTPPALSQIEPSQLDQFIDNTNRRIDSADRDAKQKEDQKKDKTDDEKKKLDEQIAKLNTDQTRLKKELAEAKHLADLFDRLKTKPCGYRIYFVVDDRDQNVEVDLVKAEAKDIGPQQVKTP